MSDLKPIHRRLISREAIHLLSRLEILTRQLRRAHGRGAIDPLILRHACWSKRHAPKGTR